MINEQIIKEFSASEKFLSFEGMEIAVKSQQEKMLAKGRIFDCEVLERKEDPKSSFFIFLTSLQDKKEFRTQFIYLIDEHWSCGDVYIEKGKINIFLFDAANSISHIFTAILDILNIFPDSTLYYCGPSIQKTLHECAYYALDNALALSKSAQLHEELAKVDTKISLGPFKTYGDYIKHAYINNHDTLCHIDAKNLLKLIDYIKPVSLNTLPQSLGSLFKNMQSIKLYARFVAPRNFQLNNGKKLQDYLELHKKTVDSKPQLRGLDHKMKKIKETALKYIEQQNDMEQQRQEDPTAHSAACAKFFPNFLTLHYLHTAPQTSKDIKEKQADCSNAYFKL